MQHYSPLVATAAKFFKDNISVKSAFDIPNVSRLSYHDVCKLYPKKIFENFFQ